MVCTVTEALEKTLSERKPTQKTTINIHLLFVTLFPMLLHNRFGISINTEYSREITFKNRTYWKQIIPGYKQRNAMHF